jgi:hypothetical protein
MDRPDLSTELVHFIRAESAVEAFNTLRSILEERRLLGGTGFIKGGFRCICFCEAPIRFVADAMARRSETGIRYQPFGIALPKTVVFAKGGRPVIYQSDAEFALLRKELRWRHVRYEPHAVHPVDFTWEREWRLPADEFPLDPAEAQVLVANRDHLNHLVNEFNDNQHYEVWHLAQVLGEIAELYREDFPWKVRVIDNMEALPFPATA